MILYIVNDFTLQMVIHCKFCDELVIFTKNNKTYYIYIYTYIYSKFCDGDDTQEVMSFVLASHGLL